MEAQPITDGGIKFQTLGELIEEAEKKGYKSEDQLIQYNIFMTVISLMKTLFVEAFQNGLIL